MIQANWPFENILINCSFLFLFITMICYWAHLTSFFKNTFLKLGKFGAILSNFTILILLILRWFQSGHFPLSNRATSKSGSDFEFEIQNIFKSIYF